MPLSTTRLALAAYSANLGFFPLWSTANALLASVQSSSLAKHTSTLLPCFLPAPKQSSGLTSELVTSLGYSDAPACFATSSSFFPSRNFYELSLVYYYCFYLYNDHYWYFYCSSYFCSCCWYTYYYDCSSCYCCYYYSYYYSYYFSFYYCCYCYDRYCGYYYLCNNGYSSNYFPLSLPHSSLLCSESTRSCSDVCMCGVSVRVKLWKW